MDFSLWGTVYRYQWVTTKLITTTVLPVPTIKASTLEMTLIESKLTKNLEELNEYLVQSFEGRCWNLKILENKCAVFRANNNPFSLTKREFLISLGLNGLQTKFRKDFNFFFKNYRGSHIRLYTLTPLYRVHF